MKSLAIKGVLTKIESKMDRNGNIYRAFRYIDTMTGHGCVAQADNIDAIPYYLHPDNPMQVLIQSQEMPKRAFMSLTKDWPAPACKPEDLASFIEQQIKKESNSTK